jgi:hypothetical protein
MKNTSFELGGLISFISGIMFMICNVLNPILFGIGIVLICFGAFLVQKS